MHIFLVNDDGIGAKGIMALMHAALRRGHRVTMCAPKKQQSAASHRFTLADPLFAGPYDLGEANAIGWYVDGSPADCVRIGLNELIDSPVDVVISGINDGYNAGVAVHYSGTVGAAMEGAFHHLPSIASSIHHKATQAMLDHLAEYTIIMAEQYVKVEVPSIGAGASFAKETIWNSLKSQPLVTVTLGETTLSYNAHNMAAYLIVQDEERYKELVNGITP